MEKEDHTVENQVLSDVIAGIHPDDLNNGQVVRIVRIDCGQAPSNTGTEYLVTKGRIIGKQVDGKVVSRKVVRLRKDPKKPIKHFYSPPYSNNDPA